MKKRGGGVFSSCLFQVFSDLFGNHYKMTHISRAKGFIIFSSFGFTLAAILSNLILEMLWRALQLVLDVIRFYMSKDDRIVIWQQLSVFVENS